MLAGDRLHIHYNHANTWVDIAKRRPNGGKRWHRLKCHGVMLTMNEVVSNLFKGNNTQPPCLRHGGDTRGTFIEIIQPAWLFRKYGTVTSRILGVNRTTLVGSLRSFDPPTIRLYDSDVLI